MNNQTQIQHYKKMEQFYKFHHYHYGQPIHICPDKYSFYEIYIFASGNISYIVEGCTYQIGSGDILLISKDETHHPDPHSLNLSCECFVFWLNETFFTYLYGIREDLTACFKDASTRNYRLFRSNKIQMNKIWKVCETIESEQKNHELGNYIIAYSSMVELLVLLNRAYYEVPDIICKNIEKNKQINRVITYINEHLTEELTLEHIAKQFHISKYHLSHQFKEYTGFSPYQYIMKKRLSAAYRMLYNGKSVTFACMESGFSDYSNFLKAFKREFGRNPSEFAKSS